MEECLGYNVGFSVNNKEEFMGMLFKDLKSLCGVYGLSRTGNKAVLQSKLHLHAQNTHAIINLYIF